MASKVQRGHIHHQRLNKPKPHKRPCRSAPAAPTGVSLSFHKRQRHHPKRTEWLGRVHWNAVTVDVAGRTIDIEAYQWQIQAVDRDGESVETRGQETLSLISGQGMNVQGGSAPVNAGGRELNAGGDIIQQTLTGLTVGVVSQVMFYGRKDLSGSAPTVKIEIWNVTDNVSVTSKNVTPESRLRNRLIGQRTFTPASGKTYAARVSWQSGTGIAIIRRVEWHDKGNAAIWRGMDKTSPDDADFHAAQVLPRPAAWYYQARVRARNDVHGGECWSAWSAWTTAANAVGDTLAPEAPINVLTTKPRARLLITTWDEPENPEDVAEYLVEVTNLGEIRESVFTRGRHHKYQVPEEDAGTAHRVKVYSVDEEGVVSGSADPGADITEGGQINAAVVEPATTLTNVQIANGELVINTDGTIDIPIQTATGFQTPTLTQSIRAVGSPTLVWTWGSKTKAGATLVAFIMAYFDSGTASTIPTPTGWTSVGTVLNTDSLGGWQRLSVFKIESAAVRSGAESVTISGTGNTRGIIMEWAGTDVQDVALVTSTDATPATTIATGTTLATTQTVDVVLAGFATRNTGTGTLAPTISGYVSDGTTGSGDRQLTVAHKITSATGTQTATADFFTGSLVQGATGIITFKAKVAAATVDTPAAGLVTVFARDQAGSKLAYKGDDGITHPLTGALIGARVYKSGAVQTISVAGSPAAITFDAEDYDPYLFHSTSVNNARLTIPTGQPGYYYICGSASTDLNATHNNRASLQIRKNGATVLASVRTILHVAPGGHALNPVMGTFYLTDVEYVELVLNTPDEGIDVQNQQSETWFEIRYVGA